MLALGPPLSSIQFTVISILREHNVDFLSVKPGAANTNHWGLKCPQTVLTSNLNWAHKIAHSPDIPEIVFGTIDPCAAPSILAREY